ncbi:MAG: Ig-like domain-containing protein, partial [Gammaproteobacteria bacterium]|nr:Ig-like domain-containing protein [Gammaproteobacteria bacterium]
TDLTAVRAQGGMGDSNGQSGGVGTVYYQDRITNDAVLQFIGSSSDTAVTEITTGSVPDGVNLSLIASNTALNSNGDLSSITQLDNTTLTLQGNLSNLTQLTGSTLTLNGDWQLTDLQLTNSTVNQISGQMLTSNGILTLDNSQLTVGAVDRSVAAAQWSSVTLSNSSTLSHRAPTAAQALTHKGLDWQVTTMNISADSAIDVSRKGNNYNADATVGSRSGGSYGGSGGEYSIYTTNATYGDYLAPQEFGTGGYNTSLGGGSVRLTVANLTLDGQIRANGGNHIINGSGGGGSGGSVWLEVGSLTGGGLIQANGGASGGYSGGGGGGGRVAIYYDTLSATDLTAVRAQGGSGASQNGGVGTVYYQDRIMNEAVLQFIGSTAAAAVTEFTLGSIAEGVNLEFNISDAALLFNGDLELNQLDNINLTLNGSLTTSATSVSNSNLVLNLTNSLTSITQLDNTTLTLQGNLSNLTQLTDSTLTLNGDWPITDLQLVNSTVNHVSGQFLTSNGILTLDNSQLTVGVVEQALAAAQWSSVTLSNGSTLSHRAPTTEQALTHKGLDWQVTTMNISADSAIDVSGKGNNYNADATVGSRSGGSYGGSGGEYSTYTTNATYGDYLAPQEFGTGGNSSSLGGGSVKLIVTNLTLDGQIRANGGNHIINGSGGGGSGGSVWLEVGSLTGGGLIQANGGASGGYSGGGGGGGRVAIYYEQATFNFENVTSLGGVGTTQNGTDGSVHHPQFVPPVIVLTTTPLNGVALNTPVSSLDIRFVFAIDPLTLSADDIVISGPQIPVINSITTPDNIIFTVNLAEPVVTDGSYSMTVGPDILSASGRGMDQDRDDITGEIPDDVYSMNFAIDQVIPATPTLSSHSLSPTVHVINQLQTTITGDREDDTSIWMNGVQAVSLGSGVWSIDNWPLSEGDNTVIIESMDAAGNTSPAATILVLVDSIAPVITGITPANSSVLNTVVEEIAVNYTETGSGLDASNTSFTVTRDGVAVLGQLTSEAGQLTFTPAIEFTEGNYSVIAQIQDLAGLQSSIFNSSFTIDRTPPQAPTVDAAPDVTTINQYQFTGTKEANSAILVNGEISVSSSVETTWTAAVDLTEGINTLLFTARDLAGFESVATVVTITFDDTAPGAVSITADGVGDGTQVQLGWASYDEVANGN